MDVTLSGGLKHEIRLLHFDDIIVFGHTLSKYLQRFQIVFDRLHMA